jgi:hypothetical protein
VYRSNLYFTSDLSAIHLSGSILRFTPLYLSDNIYRTVCPFIASPLVHDGTTTERNFVFTKTLDICRAASGEVKLEARVHSMETTSTVKDQLENLFHLLIKTNLYERSFADGSFCIRNHASLHYAASLRARGTNFILVSFPFKRKDAGVRVYAFALFTQLI